MKATAIIAMMLAHQVALPAKMDATAGVYEKREEPTIATVAAAIDAIGVAFHEYKATNDARLEAIKKGA